MLVQAAGTLWIHTGTGTLNGNATFAAAVKSGWGFSTTDAMI
ncbi:hypothetical protein GCM10009639_57960 [Kitasatospora putterlickiae]|uniref:Uncharacterized protein n=1 Tax=Kitasatospora putterlickiae TaxID=221725 RepID=A0ABN1YFJ6_9ACTN